MIGPLLQILLLLYTLARIIDVENKLHFFFYMAPTVLGKNVEVTSTSFLC